MYNGSALKAKGKTALTPKNPRNGQKFKAEFVVVEMNLITVNYENFESVAKVANNSSALSDYVLSDFTDVFGKDRGSLPGIAHFQVDENVAPVISPSCRITRAQKA